MGRDIKYIGLGVHKEAIVIAVLNDSGNRKTPAVDGDSLGAFKQGLTPHRNQRIFLSSRPLPALDD